MRRSSASRDSLFITFVLFIAWTGVGTAQTLSGSVVDSEAGTSVPGALLELIPSNRGSGYVRQELGEDGQFGLERIRKDASYVITVTADGYCLYEERWRMPELQESAEIKIPLVRAATLSGTLKAQSTRQPLPGVEIVIWQEHRHRRRYEERRAFTGADGSFLFEGLPPAAYHFEAAVSGYITEHYEGIYLQGGQSRDLEIKMVVPARIVGRVSVAPTALVDWPPGEWPISGVTVTTEGPTRTSATTDPEGYFVLQDLRPGKYRLNYQREGFQELLSPNVFDLAEGDTIEGVEIVLDPEPRAVHLVSNRDVFRPDDVPEIQMRTFRIAEVEFALSRVPPEHAFNGNLPLFELENVAVGMPGEVILDWRKVADIGGKEFSWIDRKVEIPEKLEPGAYVLSAKAGGLESRKAFFVSTLGLVVKRGEHRLLAYACDLVTNQPVQNAQIIGKPLPPGVAPEISTQKVETFAGELERLGSTSPNGILDTVVSSDRMGLVGVRDRIHLAACHLHFSGGSLSRNRIRILGFTDRPIYRPGHTVYFKVMARREESGDLVPITDKRVSYEVYDAKRKTLTKGSLLLGEFGTAHGEFVLPEDAPLGTYGVVLEYSPASTSFSFDVEEYRKPPFKIEIESDKADYVNGERIEFAVRSRYYFGFPVRGGVVHYNVYETRLRDEDYWGRGEWGGYSSVFSSGKVLLDAEGNATIQLDAGYKFYNRRLSLEVTVEDPSRRQAKADHSVKVGKGAYLIRLQPRQRFYDVGSRVEVEVTTRSLSGSPVSADVGVTLEKEIWNALYARYEFSNRPLGSVVVHTDEEGKGTAVFPTTGLEPDRGWGRVRVSARGKDNRGNRITASRYLWILSSSSCTYSYQYKALELEIDREQFEVGETALVMIHAPEENHPLLLTVEAEDILDYRFIRSEGKTTRIEVPIRKAFAPNCFITVTYQDGIQLSSRKVEIRVKTGRPRIDLEAQIEGQRRDHAGVPEFRPGDEVTLRIQTRNETGEPTPAEIALAVVDEAIFAIRPDRTPNLEDVFYRERQNWVQTSYSFPMRHYGGAGKDKKNLQVRRNFKDTALWEPAIRTDTTGTATVAFRLPDNLTTWRLTYRGADNSSRFCVRKDSLIVSKDLLAVLEGPRFFHRGDRVELPALIHNRQDQPATGVVVRLEANSKITVEVSDRTADIGSLSSHREAWTVHVSETARSATLTVSALGESDTDAMELSLPVVRAGRPLRIAHSSIVARDARQGEVEFEIPSNTELEDLQVTVSLHASSIAATFQSIDYLRTFPFGCLEQTLNGFLPRCIMARTLEEMVNGQVGGRTETPHFFGPLFAAGDVETAATKGVRKILERQGRDGGWSWWGGGEDDPMITAFALEGLLLLKQADFNVPQDSLDRGIRRLDEMVESSNNPHVQAYGLRVLSLAGRRKDAVAKAVIGRATQGDLSPDGLAYVALYHQSSGEAATAEFYIDTMLSSVVDTDSALLWEPLSATPRPPWFGGREEMTARCLMALAACRPDDVRCAHLVAGLLLAKQGSRWSSTRATSLVVLALAEYLRARPENIRPEGTVRVECNSESVVEGAEIPVVNGIPAELSVQVPVAHLRLGHNNITIQKQDGFPVYVSVEVEGWLTGDIAAGAVEELEVQREFFLAERVVDSRGRAQILETPFAGEGPIPAGKEIGCRTILVAERAIPYVLLQVFLPSGFEVTESDFGNGWWKPYEYSECRDRSINFAFGQLGEGETRITSLLRPELAGEFYAPPASVWAMYDPEIEAWTSSGRLKVKGDAE